VEVMDSDQILAFFSGLCAVMLLLGAMYGIYLGMQILNALPTIMFFILVLLRIVSYYDQQNLKKEILELKARLNKVESET